MVSVAEARSRAPVDAARDGDAASTSDTASYDEWGSVFAAHYATVHGLLYRMVGDQADDLAQETFWRAWNARPALRIPELRPWLCRVALNLGYNALRSARRRTWYEALYQGREAAQSASPDLNPSAASERSDEAEQVRAALARLRPREAQLLLLRAQGASYREAAAVLGVADGSIGTLLRRAEVAFRRVYPGSGLGARGRSER